jgi:aryl-alcohol dehydrogenase-like predicted oxidoreductase
MDAESLFFYNIAFEQRTKTMTHDPFLRRLGPSDLMVSPIGLGCWQFSQGRGLGGGYWSVLSDEEIRDIVQASLQGGINWFDTAESYGGGRSEQLLARALKDLGKTSEDVLIATKWMPFFRTARSILKTIGRRTDNLAGFRIDLYQIHHPFSLASTKAQMKAMARLAEEHKIRFIGVSNFSAKKMRRAHDRLADLGLRLVSNQVRYNLLDRTIETNGILDTAKELGMAIIAYSPLAQGLLTGKFHEDPGLVRRTPGYRKYMGGFKQKGLDKSRSVIQALKELAEQYKVTPAQIALNWLIHVHGETVVAIPGATKMRQAQENTGALTFQLGRDELRSLDQVSSVFKK